jgi:hypothetical protein
VGLNPGYFTPRIASFAAFAQRVQPFGSAPEVRELIAAALSGKTCVPLERVQLSNALSYGGIAEGQIVICT